MKGAWLSEILTITLMMSLIFSTENIRPLGDSNVEKKQIIGFNWYYENIFKVRDFRPSCYHIHSRKVNILIIMDKL